MTPVRRPSMPCDAYFLAPRLREIDKREISAMTNKSMAGAIIECLDSSLWSETVLLDGKVEMMFGVGDEVYSGIKVGKPWLLCSGKVFETHKKEFLLQSRVVVTRMFDDFEVLANYVHLDNVHALRWLGWLGFQFSKPTLFRGEPFVLFSKVK